MFVLGIICFLVLEHPIHDAYVRFLLLASLSVHLKDWQSAVRILTSNLCR